MSAQCKMVLFHSASIQLPFTLCSHHITSLVHSHIFVLQAMGSWVHVCEQGSITLKRISQLGSDVHVVLIVCVQWIISPTFLLQERTEEVQTCS